MSVVDQILLFQRAEFVISPHGAGLANLLFCEAGTRVIELTPSVEMRPFFWLISEKLSLVHGVLFCPVAEGRGFQGAHNHRYQQAPSSLRIGRGRLLWEQAPSSAARLRPGGGRDRPRLQVFSPLTRDSRRARLRLVRAVWDSLDPKPARPRRMEHATRKSQSVPRQLRSRAAWFLRKIIAGAAFAPPLIASFSLEGPALPSAEATPAPVCSNQTTTIEFFDFAGTEYQDNFRGILRPGDINPGTDLAGGGHTVAQFHRQCQIRLAAHG